MMVQLFILSEARRATLDYIPIDTSNRDLSDGGQKYREKSGRVGLFIEIVTKFI